MFMRKKVIDINGDKTYLSDVIPTVQKGNKVYLCETG